MLAVGHRQLEGPAEVARDPHRFHRVLERPQRAVRQPLDERILRVRRHHRVKRVVPTVLQLVERRPGLLGELLPVGNCREHDHPLFRRLDRPQPTGKILLVQAPDLDRVGHVAELVFPEVLELHFIAAGQVPLGLVAHLPRQQDLVPRGHRHDLVGQVPRLSVELHRLVALEGHANQPAVQTQANLDVVLGRPPLHRQELVPILAHQPQAEHPRRFDGRRDIIERHVETIAGPPDQGPRRVQLNGLLEQIIVPLADRPIRRPDPRDELGVAHDVGDQDELILLATLGAHPTHPPPTQRRSTAKSRPIARRPISWAPETNRRR